MDEATALHQAVLVDAIAAEHRMRRLALEQQQLAQRWRERARFAAERGLDDLARQALGRVERHETTSARYRQRADEIRLEIARLRQPVDPRSTTGLAPPDPLERQFAELEIERELALLKQRLRRDPPAPAAHRDDPEEPSPAQPSA